MVGAVWVWLAVSIDKVLLHSPSEIFANLVGLYLGIARRVNSKMAWDGLGKLEISRTVYIKMEWVPGMFWGKSVQRYDQNFSTLS